MSANERGDGECDRIVHAHREGSGADAPQAYAAAAGGLAAERDSRYTSTGSLAVQTR